MQIDTGQFLALKETAERGPGADMPARPFQVLAAYNAGFVDGRDRLAEEVGLPAVPRIRDSAGHMDIASWAAEEQDVLGVLYDVAFDAGRASVFGAPQAGGRHAAPRRQRQRPAFLRVVGGDAS
jgi:hypothetical protein